MTNKITADVGGILTVISSVFMTIWNAFRDDPINVTLVTFTGIGGLIYVFYRIINERKKSKLLDLEIAQRTKEEKK